MNLLNSLQNQLSPTTVSQISNAVGESPEATKSALSTAFPVLLGSMLGKAQSSPSGLTDMFNLIKQGNWSDSLGTIMGSFSGSAGQTTSPTGQSLLNSLLGTNLGAVKDFVASRCGIRASSASSILGMAAPMVMGALGKAAASPADLGQTLGSQAQYLKGALPAGLADTFGINNLLSGMPDAVETGERATPESEATPQFEYGRPSPRQPVVATARQPAAASFLKWAWVPLALLAAVWFFAARSNRDKMGGTSEDTYRSAPAGNYSNARLPAGSAANNLSQAIASKDWNRTIHLDGFDSSDTMSDSARGELNEIGFVLANAPEVNVQVTGYGETEEAGLRQANSVKSSLAKTGVATHRISTRGEVGTGMPTLKPSRP